MTRTHLLPLAFLMPAAGLLGCSSNKLVPAKVSGNITFNGQPIKAGTIQFHTGGVAYPGVINNDGTYSAADLPEGDMVVTVTTEHLNPGLKAAPKAKDYDRRMKMQQQPESGPPPAEPYIKIPDKYKNANTSPLSVTLSRGRQVKDLELVP